MSKLKRRNNKPVKKLNRIIKKIEEQVISPKKTFVKSKLNRERCIIHKDPNDIICYVCGKRIEREYYKIKKKIEGKIQYQYMIISPLVVGYKDGVKLYRHRNKDNCQPMSETYVKKLKHFIPDYLLRAYEEGLELVKEKKRLKKLRLSLSEDEEPEEENNEKEEDEE